MSPYCSVEIIFISEKYSNALPKSRFLLQLAVSHYTDVLVGHLSADFCQDPLGGITVCLLINMLSFFPWKYTYLTDCTHTPPNVFNLN